MDYKAYGSETRKIIYETKIIFSNRIVSLYNRVEMRYDTYIKYT